MGRVNAPMIALNRGLIDPDTLARTDLDRTRMSAEIMDNWLPKTQGSMRIRPGTKHLGSSYGDTGAEFIEFVAATDDTALLELTDSRMRVWIDDALMGRTKVNTTVSFNDTGWADSSVGNAGGATGQSPLVPIMSDYTNGDVTISASSELTEEFHNGLYYRNNAWRAFNRVNDSGWVDTGYGAVAATRPSWINVDFGSGNTATVASYEVTSADVSYYLDNAPRAWRLLVGPHDTGTYATDTGKWTTLDEETNVTGWAAAETKSFDIGAPAAYRHYRFYITLADTGRDTPPGTIFQTAVGNLQYLSGDTGTATQVATSGGVLTLNASSLGAIARATKQVNVDTGDRDVEHSLKIQVGTGPVQFRVGSSSGDDDLVSSTTLSTGHHNLAFTPSGSFHITFETDALVNREVSSISIGDSGTVEITSPWGSDDLDTIRYDQSADVVFVDASNGVKPYKIERRGTGRSWSVVENTFDKGPFLPGRTSSAKLSFDSRSGNTVMRSDIPFFKPGHVGALFRVTYNTQNGSWWIGGEEAYTHPIKMSGILDTGFSNVSGSWDTGRAAKCERAIQYNTLGAYSGKLTLERSIEGPESGYRSVDTGWVKLGSGSWNDTGTTNFYIVDPDDNVDAWYRVGFKSGDLSSGAARVDGVYPSGTHTGVARVLSYVNNQAVQVEIPEHMSDKVITSDWEESAWSGVQGYPTAVALHEGRLFHAGKTNIWGSVADDFQNLDDSVEGDAGPIIRSLGSGPVDNIYYLISLVRLIVGTAGSEIAVRSSSFDEVLTPTNNSAKAFSTQGSKSLRALKVDSRAFFVQRSGKRLFSIAFGESGTSADYDSNELTLLVPKLMDVGVVSVAVQRQPDTRIHCVLADGRVAILTYEPQEEVLAWSTWSGDTGVGTSVERAMVLPGADEDQVYYHVQRTINGTKRRFLEKWATEAESVGDTGLSYIADCAAAWSDTGASGFTHLVGAAVTAWADDTGSVGHGKDLSTDDTGGTQQLLTVDTGGGVAGTGGISKGVAGLPYEAKFMSAKLAYAAEAGTALTQHKRVSQVGLVLRNTHNNGLFVGDDTGHVGATLDPLPRVNNTDTGTVDIDKIYTDYDEMSFPVNGDFEEDSRLTLVGKAPRPVTVLGAIPSIETNEEV